MMKETPDDGGPAFPLPPPNPASHVGSGVMTGYAVTYGMSLRDYFAAQALVGLIASNDEGAGDRIEEVPSYAYQIADAMIEARKR